MCEGGKDLAVGPPVSWFHEGHHPSLEGKALRPKAWNVNGFFMDGPSKEHIGSAKTATSTVVSVEGAIGGGGGGTALLANLSVSHKLNSALFFICAFVCET